MGGSKMNRFWSSFEANYKEIQRKFDIFVNFDVKISFAPATLSQRPLVRSALLSPLDTTTLQVETSPTTYFGDMGRRLAQELKKVMRLRQLEVRHIFPFIIVIPDSKPLKWRFLEHIEIGHFALIVLSVGQSHILQLER